MRRDYRIRLHYADKGTFREPLFYPGKAHGFLCAPSRQGKFRDLLAAIMFSYPGSVVYVDSKAQACAVTARFRARKLRQKVVRIDPFNLLPRLPGVKWCPPLVQYDPIARIDPRSDSFGADSDNVTEWLLAYEAHVEKHWVDSSRRDSSGVIMYLKKWFPKETLVTLYHIVSCPRDLILIARDAQRRAAFGDETDRFIADRLSRYTDPDCAENRETRSILSTMQTGLHFIGNKCIADSLSGSTFDFGAMKREPVTCYLILPGEYLTDGNTSKWFRLIVGSGMDRCIREVSRRIPALWILDEFKAAIGKLGVVETMMGLGAGYGIQLLNVFQNLSQLQELWPTGWETFLANSGFRIWYAPQDLTTQDYLSRACGEAEVRTISKSMSEGRNGELSVNLSFGQHGRRYLLPHETRDNVGRNEALIFGENIPGVIRAGRLPYFLDPAFRRCADPDPWEYGKEKHARGLLGKVFGW